MIEDPVVDPANFERVFAFPVLLDDLHYSYRLRLLDANDNEQYFYENNFKTLPGTTFQLSLLAVLFEALTPILSPPLS